MGSVVEKVRNGGAILSLKHARITQRSLRIRDGAACAAANRESQYAFCAAALRAHQNLA